MTAVNKVRLYDLAKELKIDTKRLIEEVRRDCERQFIAGKEHATAFFVAKIDMLFELGERSNAVLELPFPIVPKFARHTGPKARCMRHELFSIAIPKRFHFE